MDNIQKSIDYMKEKSADIKDKVCFLDDSSEVYRIAMEVAGYYDNAVSALEMMRKSKQAKLDDCAMNLAKAMQSAHNNMLMNMCCCRVTPENDPYYAERLKCNGWTI